ncbi:GATA zinc finger domain-containing protein 14-like [Zerene cesonia]|uniref:GATA zinc finger domain-containing protein 14-like n=1 Tax=Zerene cesonia TaxID=33412 RepID=UPI0018E56CB9|nr:GATA zinc finger domain-containing protein 14-like [Zerene cesonia]
MEIVKKSIEEAKSTPTEIEASSAAAVFEFAKNISSASDLLALVQASIQSSQAASTAPIVQTMDPTPITSVQPRSFGDPQDQMERKPYNHLDDLGTQNRIPTLGGNTGSLGGNQGSLGGNQGSLGGNQGSLGGNQSFDSSNNSWQTNSFFDVGVNQQQSSNFNPYQMQPMPLGNFNIPPLVSQNDFNSGPNRDMQYNQPQMPQSNFNAPGNFNNSYQPPSGNQFSQASRGNFMNGRPQDNHQNRHNNPNQQQFGNRQFGNYEQNNYRGRGRGYGGSQRGRGRGYY